MDEVEGRLPPEINMMYKTVRVFGHFDKPVFLSLCKVNILSHNKESLRILYSEYDIPLI